MMVIVGGFVGGVLGILATVAVTLLVQMLSPNDKSAGSVAIVIILFLPAGIFVGLIVGAIKGRKALLPPLPAVLQPPGLPRVPATLQLPPLPIEVEEDIFSVTIILKEGTSVPGKFSVRANGRCLVLTFGDRSLMEKAPDTFEALVQIRRGLDGEGIKILCYGACKDVRPSGMSRSMCGGVQAYRFALGRKPTRNDLVHIFETGPDVVPVTVAEQEQYFDMWVRSVSNPA